MTGRDVVSKVAMRGMILKGHIDLQSMHSNTKDARKKNEKLLFKILKRSQTSEYGQRYDFANIHSVEEFRQKVPVSTYADYEHYIDRMVDNNEENLLCSIPVKGYAQTSGSVGQRKLIPLTQPEVDIYTKYTVTRMLALADNYHKERYGKPLPLGRGLLTMPGFRNKLPNGLYYTNAPDLAARDLALIMPYILAYPVRERFRGSEAEFKYTHMRFALEDKEIVYMFSVFFHEHVEYIRYLKKHWQELADDIEKGVIGELAHAVPRVMEAFSSAVKPNPERAAELRREFEKGFDSTLIKRLWPNMSAICGIGTATFAPFAERMRAYTEGIPFDFSIYGASEGLFAACDALDSPKQLLLVDSCYYEFNPADDPNTFLSLDELEVGKEYEIIITNQAGFYRYKCGDIIRVLDYCNDCPYVVFGHREGQLLSITGEKTTEEHMTALVKLLEEKAGCTINAWTAHVEVGDEQSNYVLLAENEQGIDLTPYSDYANDRLMEINLRYPTFFGYVYGPIRILNQKYGTHREWAEKRMEASNGELGTFQIKPVRILDTPEKEEFFLSRVVE